MNKRAFWINPKGKVFELKSGIHIGYIIKNPTKFGETKKTLQDTYDKYNENMPHEGKAREEIMVRALVRGFIRIRETTRGWSIQLNKLTQKFDDFIWTWAKSIIGSVNDKYADVTIHELITNKTIKKSFDQLAEDDLVDELLNKHLNKLYEDNPLRENKIVFVESIDEFDDINESSLSRIMTHIQSNKDFGVISPFRKDKSDDENIEGYKELVATIREMGLGYIQMKGGYQEETGFIDEKSLFVPGIKRKDIIELGKEYKQDSIIHKDDKDFSVIGTNRYTGIGKILSSFKVTGRNISVDDVGDIFTEFFSRLVKGSHRGKKFLFVSEIHTGSSFVADRVILEDVLTGEVV